MIEKYLEYLALNTIYNERRKCNYIWKDYNLYEILKRKSDLEKEILEPYVIDTNSKEI